MAILVIGRRIDLAIVAIYAMSAAWTLHLANSGASIPVAMLLGYLFALSAGVLNGVLIAYFEIPRSVRDSGHGLAGLWLRALRPRAPLCSVYARKRLQHRLDGQWICVRGADADSIFRACRLARVRLLAVHQTWTIHLCDRRQFRGGAHVGR